MNPIVRYAFAVAMLTWLAPTEPLFAVQAEPLAGDPGEVICTVDGQPIYRGEFNLLLAEQLAGQPIDTASAAMRSAIAVNLVRRHLAMRTLVELGGETLQQRIKQATTAAAQQAQSRGDSLSDLAARTGSDMRSLARDLQWKTGWAMYLRSRLTDENLQRFFAANRSQYDGTKLHVSHIFFKHAADDPLSRQQSLTNITEISERLRAAESRQDAFAEAAREHSEAESAGEDGDIGWVTAQGDLPPASATALFTAGPKPDAIIGPVTSPLGVHLYYIHEVQAGAGSIAEMPDQAPLRRDAATAMYNALVRTHKSADVQWQVKELQPPAGFSIIP